MDTTLGKRIMAERKKLGLTQDKLAETLGVTAQAVSKWENDLSCPDITMLPRLAALFGITIDELLGVTKEAEEIPVVLEGTVEDTSKQKERPNFELQFEHGKRDGIFISAFILFVGALTLMSTVFNWGASFWNILWPSTILGFGVRGLIRKFSYFSLVCSLFGGYFLLENLAITDVNISWKLIFPVLLLLLGVTLLIDSFKRPMQNRWKFSRNGKICDSSKQGGTLVNNFSVNGKTFNCELAFGETYRQVKIDGLLSGSVDCSFGDLTLDLCECESFAENCRLDVDCSFGSVTLLVPRSVQVIPNNSTAFAGFEIKDGPNADAASVIYLEADASFASVTVQYV